MGGLIEHPTESTKHFTILRHSHGIVFYRGPTTTMAMSVFSDAPLPSNRTYWLQDKGYSGKTGMKAKSFLHIRGNWINVTPSMAVRADQVKPDDERAWQRDLSKFQKKAPVHVRATQRLRETVVVRIPSVAQDGYYALVLCIGDKQKVLCTSPIVRILSTSASPSSVRGASLGTLPLELGAMVLGKQAQGVASTVLSPVSNAVQSYIPSGLSQGASAADTAAQTVYSHNEDNISQTNNEHVRVRGRGELNIENGPVPPYPINFSCTAQAAFGESEPAGRPQVNLIKPPEQTLRRLHGHYLGWARFRDTTVKEKEKEKEQPPAAWNPILLTVLSLDVTQLARVDMSHALKRSVKLVFLDEVTIPPQMKVEVRVLGFIRPDSTPTPAAGSRSGPATTATSSTINYRSAEIEEKKDINLASRFLRHPSWGPKARPRSMSLTDRYGDVQMRGQQLVDSVPLNQIGIRKPTDDMREKQLSINGFYIKRG